MKAVGHDVVDTGEPVASICYGRWWNVVGADRARGRLRIFGTGG